MIARNLTSYKRIKVTKSMTESSRSSLGKTLRKELK